MPAQGSENELKLRPAPFRIPPMRSAWIQKRLGHANVSQMHYARQGVVTEEMAFVARRENLPDSLVMEEVARGRMIIPANINHPNLEPMAIGIASRCKVNANIGASPNASDVGEELKKLMKLPEWQTVQRAPSTFRFPGGESFTEMQTRMVNTLDRLRQRHRATDRQEGRIGHL